jgi:PAS domain S-box-containing protein
MPFIDRKDTGIIPQVLTAILDECINGITLADPDMQDCPIIYTNKAFENLTGYSRDEIVGRNCRFLQAVDRDQEAVKKVKNAIDEHKVIEVTLRNYKKDGTLFHNHLKITPLTDKKGKVLYLLGVQYDISYQVNAENEIKKLSGLLTQAQARR